MERFYQHLALEEDTSSALRNAKLDLLASHIWRSGGPILLGRVRGYWLRFCVH
jgi:hypothetical protein